ncbi:MAG: choice-of-anchor L domain-containing protein [Deltaproteobacteria bacterium]|nr:choice-of-anchor L domain-containing protein [Nannocystaceae bacterium]
MGTAPARTCGFAVALVIASACGSGSDGLAEDGSPTTGDTTSTGSGSGSGTAADTTAGESGDDGCVDDVDCTVPGLGKCNAQNGTCRGCLDDADCPQHPVALACNDAGFCEGCTADNHCPLGTTCQAGVCAPGCNDEQPCPGSYACCGTCVDPQQDAKHCGGCDAPCPERANGAPTCAAGECSGVACDVGWADCNGVVVDGCETEGECTCAPGATQPCYSGDASTRNVGACVDGEQTCNELGTAWSGCVGELLPGDELCANAADDDCDGDVDEDIDADGDGWTACTGGDCCDEEGPICGDPALVNPGAFEVDGNDVDDDCDGVSDNPLLPCDGGLASNSADPNQYAQALDLCRFTDAAPADPVDRVWGVIDGTLARADGVGAPAPESRSLRDGFGDNIDNRFGDRMVVLSTGRAADDAGDVNPGFDDFQSGQIMGTDSPFPIDWYAANGFSLPNAPGCPVPLDDTDAQDPVLLELTVRVPTNANSFSVDMFFFSAEYPEYVCTAYNDFFVALVDSTDPSNPADKNIAIYDDGVSTWPVGVNIVDATDGLFTACTDHSVGACGDDAHAYSGCTSNALLQGTGFDNPGEVEFACAYGGEAGGGTGWLTMSGNVTPGETMEIRFVIWDTSDGLYDSLVLLDNWQWSVQASTPGVEPG